MLKQVCKVIDIIKKYYIFVIFSESMVFDKFVCQVVCEFGVYYGGVLYVDFLSVVDGFVLIYLDLLCVMIEIIVNGINDGLRS